MKNLMVLLTRGVVLALAAAFIMTDSQAAEQDKPKRESKAADSPEARKRAPAPESRRDQGARRPRDGERAPRDGAQRDRGPRNASPRDRGPGRGFDPRRLPLMAALDVDRDGQLSAQEIKNAAAALKKLDKNEDGKLTPDELRPQFGDPGGPGGFGGPGFGGPRPDGDRPPGRPDSGGRPQGQDMAKRLMAMDANGDGKITKEEMPERMQQMLQRIDTNGDGAVDKEEARKMAERFNRGDRPHGDRPPGDQRGARQGGDRPPRPQRPEQ